MATFVVCTRCGKVKETEVLAQIPAGWNVSENELHCLSCRRDAEDGSGSDVIDEEVIYPSSEDTVDEDFDEGCAVCGGPCRGH